MEIISNGGNSSERRAQRSSRAGRCCAAAGAAACCIAAAALRNRQRRPTNRPPPSAAGLFLLGAAPAAGSSRIILAPPAGGATTTHDERPRGHGQRYLPTFVTPAAASSTIKRSPATTHADDVGAAAPATDSAVMHANTPPLRRYLPAASVPACVLVARRDGAALPTMQPLHSDSV